ncbi:MAG: hypothetical protein JWP33_95 [Blastococcus sp.]|nr:hypothetical protein [Blastococcus sp.]
MPDGAGCRGSGAGRPCRHGGGFDLAAAATALGLSEDELRAALQTDGTTLAEVAEDEGVAVDTVIGALVQAREERIAQAVEAGRLTQDEADERLAGLEARVTARVDSADPRGGGRGPGGGHGPHGHHGDASTED